MKLDELASFQLHMCLCFFLRRNAIRFAARLAGLLLFVATIENVCEHLGQTWHILAGLQHAGGLLEFSLQLRILIHQLGQHEHEQKWHDHHQDHGTHEQVEYAELFALKKVVRVAFGLEIQGITLQRDIRRLQQI